MWTITSTGKSEQVADNRWEAIRRGIGIGLRAAGYELFDAQWSDDHNVFVQTWNRDDDFFDITYTWSEQ